MWHVEVVSVPHPLSCSALTGGGGVLYCAVPTDCQSAPILSWLSSAMTAPSGAANTTNSALYGPLVATPPLLFTAPIVPQCGALGNGAVFSSADNLSQVITVPSGCPLSVSLRLSDALNNTVVSSVADAGAVNAVDGACAGGETSVLLSRGSAAVTLSVSGGIHTTVSAALTVRSQLIAASSTFVVLSSGAVEFVVGNAPQAQGVLQPGDGRR